MSHPNHKQHVPEELQLKKTLGVRVTESDAKTLENLAINQGKSTTEYARELLLKQLELVLAQS